MPQNQPAGVDYGGCSDVPGKGKSYRDCYGSSYRFTRGAFSTIDGVSPAEQCALQRREFLLPADRADCRRSFRPAETRLMRDEMLPWFGGEADPGGAKYGYYPDYYRRWHARGGGFIFADGHAKLIVSAGQFDQIYCDPAATKNFTDSGYESD
ncbi:MAG: hypothetical protein QM758_23880 [Armatimonas sp.]